MYKIYFHKYCPKNVHILVSHKDSLELREACKKADEIEDIVFFEKGKYYLLNICYEGRIRQNYYRKFIRMSSENKLNLIKYLSYHYQSKENFINFKIYDTRTTIYDKIKLKKI